jgi:hypothetical protein
MPKRAKETVQAVAAAAVQPERTQPREAMPDLKKPTIAEIFGPGGAIEKYMPGGYEHRPTQLEMAELVEAAFKEKRHLIVEAGTGTGKTLAYGHEISSRAAFREGHSVSEEIFRAGIESGRDEGARQFSVPRESLPDGRPARAERF